MNFIQRELLLLLNNVLFPDNVLGNLKVVELVWTKARFVKQEEETAITACVLSATTKALHNFWAFHVVEVCLW